MEIGMKAMTPALRQLGSASRTIVLKGNFQEAALPKISSYFSEFGKVLSVDFGREKFSKSLTGVAFVTFDESSAADKARNQINHDNIGFPLSVRPAFNRNAVSVPASELSIFSGFL